MSTTEEKKVQDHKHEQGDSDDDHDHEHEHGPNCNHEHDHEDPNDPNKKSNRGQKKFKKAMGKMGLKPVTGINRVTLKRGKAFVISIDDPDIWKSPGNESAYIIFGKPNMDGLQSGQNEIGQFKNPVNVENPTETPVQNTNNPIPEQKTEESTDLSEEGLNPDNIKMVMEYTKCSKAEAIRVLRETGDDSVNAIMKLTK